MGLYHIKTTGTKTSGVSVTADWSNANCYSTPHLAIIQAASVSGPHLFLIDIGIYNSYIDLSAAGANLDGSEFIGFNASADRYAEIGEVRIERVNTTIIKNNRTSVSLKKLTSTFASDSYGYLSNTGGSLNIDGLWLANAKGNAFTVSGGDVTVKDLSIKDSTLHAISQTGGTLYIDTFSGKGCKYKQMVSCSVGSMSIDNFLISPSETMPASILQTNGYGIVSSGAASAVKLNKGIIYGSAQYAASVISTGTMEINDSILFAGDEITGASPARRWSGAGNLIINNSVLIPSWRSPTTYVSGAVTQNNTLLSANPKFTRQARRGMIGLSIDDNSNIDYAISLIPSLIARGVSATLFVNYTALPSDVTKLQTLRQSGVFEIGWHARTHSDLAATTAFTVLKEGQSITIDRSTDMITVSGGHVLTPYKALTLTSIRSWLTTTAGCTLGALTSNLHGIVLGECLDSVATSSIDSALTLPLLLDTSLAGGYYKTEILDGKILIESALGFQLTSMSTPYNTSNSAIRTAIKNAGLACNRSGAPAQGATHRLDSINIYALTSALLISSTHNETTTLGIIRTHALQMEQAGGCLINLIHDADEGTVEEWELMIDTLQSEFPLLKIGSVSQIASEIIQSGSLVEETSESKVYTLLVSDQSDYHLQPTSPCVGAGTKIPGINKDIEGNPLYPPYNIGPYGMEAGALGVAPVANDGPPRNNITRLTGEATTIDPAGTYELADTNAWRIVTGWTAGTANDFFDADGLPITFTGQQLIDSGVGPRFYCGLKGIAGYTVDQDAPTNAKIIKTLKISTYIDRLYYSDFQEMDWSASNE